MKRSIEFKAAIIRCGDYFQVYDVSDGNPFENGDEVSPANRPPFILEEHLSSLATPPAIVDKVESLAEWNETENDRMVIINRQEA